LITYITCRVYYKYLSQNYKVVTKTFFVFMFVVWYFPVCCFLIGSFILFLFIFIYIYIYFQYRKERRRKEKEKTSFRKNKQFKKTKKTKNKIAFNTKQQIKLPQETKQ